MRIEHFLITPFCIRSPDALRDARGGGFNGKRDPLAPEFLEGRLKLVEMISAATVNGQTNLDFTWLILIDPELESRYRERLLVLCGDRVRVILHEYRHSDPWDSAGWLSQYVRGEPDFLLTTNLDDDDGLSRSYIEKLMSAATTYIESTQAPLVRTFGCKSIRQWNRIRTRVAPLGTRSEWSGSNKVTSCGFALLCKYPEIPLTVLALRHKRAENYLDFASDPADESVAAFRARLTSLLSNNGIVTREHWEHLRFEDLGDRAGVLISNHVWNVQTRRMLKQPIRPVSVSGPETFPDHALNWVAAGKYLPEFQPPYSDRLRSRMRELRSVVAGMLR
jgi:hypothetical protein